MHKFAFIRNNFQFTLIEFYKSYYKNLKKPLEILD